MVGPRVGDRRGRLAAALVGALLMTGCATTVPGTPSAAPGGSGDQGGGDQGGGDQGNGDQGGGDRGGGDQSSGPDPAAHIEGVLSIEYPHGSTHVVAPQRVAYDHLPPLGGAHDSYWAPCMGQVFTVAVRTEHFVHSMEHGAVWITYDPGKLRGAELKPLLTRVEGQPYMVMSPFPGQKTAVSVQSWGKQLQVEVPDDPRIDQFVAAIRGNPDLAPEPGARCDGLGPDVFDEDDPPPFEPGPPGPDAVPVTGG